MFLYTPRPAAALARAGATLAHPWAPAVVVALIGLAMGGQFLADATRSVPAFDASWYQWRAEYIQANDPGGMITIRGADGALAGGYRVAEPVLGALMRTVGGVAEGTPTVVLSVLFRVLAATALAAFAWQHRKDRLLMYLTLILALPIFLLQRFFGFLDNFFALALMAGVLLLLEPMRTSWTARVVAGAFLFLGGLTHPTTLGLFLLSFGAIASWHVIRERSIRAALRSEGPIILAGTVAVLLMVATWMGGLWGPTAGLGEAAVPPPQPVSYFIQRSISVLSNLTPIVFVPLLIIGIVHLATGLIRKKEWFSEITLAWTLPLAGMFGFVLGAAYPYFRFFNGTLAPILVAAAGVAVVLRAPARLGGSRGRIATVAVAVAVIAFIAMWWARGLSMWNSAGSWLTPEVREEMAAARGYLEATEGAPTALFVIDAQPDPEIVPYGEYKEYTNSIYAGIGGERIRDAFVYFGRVEDLLAGKPTSLGDEQYDELSAGASVDALRVMRESFGDAVLLLPTVFNQYSTNLEYVDGCADCVRLSESGLFLLPGGASPSDPAIAAGRAAGSEAREFEASPPGPFAGLGGTLLALVRLALLLMVPGLLLIRRIPAVGALERLALVPLLSITAVTVVGTAGLAVIRGPLTPTVGWVVWAIASAGALAVAFAGSRRVEPRQEGTGRLRPGGAAARPPRSPRPPR
ncbi:MAG TPA: hypothetical protein VGR49_05360 [Actinomycetota bacterium]|nr:hypothetical protein [Actinomycetota bacterium]